MPTTKPRVAVTLTPEAGEIVAKLAKINGTSQGAVVWSVLEPALPVLERVIIAAEHLASMQARTRSDLAAAFQGADAILEPHRDALEDVLESLMRTLEGVVAADAAGAGSAVPQRSEDTAGTVPAPPPEASDPRPCKHGGQTGAARGVKRSRKVPA